MSFVLTIGFYFIMRYVINKQTIEYDVFQESELDKNQYHVNELISKQASPYKNGYKSVDLNIEELELIRKRSLQVINSALSKHSLDNLIFLEDYHKVVPSDEIHLQVLKTIGKLIQPQNLGIDVGLLASEIKNHFKIDNYELDCRFVCDLRILRPYRGAMMDNNPLHRDSWLKIIGDCINVFIPIAGVTNKSSLSLIPQSHLWDGKYIERTVSNAFIGNVQYGLPAVTGINRKFKLIRPKLAKNQILIFSSNIIHGGAVNLNQDSTRVSIELRFWIK